MPSVISGFLAKGQLSIVSGQLRMSANDKGDNKMTSGFVHRSPGIYHAAEENSWKPQLGGSLEKAVDQSSPQMRFLISK